MIVFKVQYMYFKSIKLNWLESFNFLIFLRKKSHLMSDVKRLGLTYKNDMRVKGVGSKAPKGVIVGLKFIDHDDSIDETLRLPTNNSSINPLDE